MKFNIWARDLPSPLAATPKQQCEHLSNVSMEIRKVVPQQPRRMQKYLYQRKACQQGKDCKRAHVCKACWRDHTMADCKLFPVLNSPFNPSTWRTSLHDFSDLSFTDDLIYDIEHGGCIRYTGPTTSHISLKHLSAIWNITSTALELERELGLGQDRPITHPFRQKFCQIADRCYSQKAFKTC